MRSDSTGGGDRGMVTAELAAALPVLVLVLGAALAVLRVSAMQLHLVDTTREVARAAARGDTAAVSRFEHSGVGARISLTRDGDEVTARASLMVPVLGSWLGPVTVSAQSTALLEPGVVVR
jgi:hypothetical protein